MLIGDRHRLPVRTAVLLLRPEADRASLDGKLNKEGSEGQCYLAFSYTVVRLWEQSVEALLDAGVGLLPLAPLANVATDQLPGVIGRIDQRLRAEVTDAERADLWSASYILLGLRYSAPFAAQLFEGVRGMEESTTFQAIITQGALREARKILFSLGTQRLGKPDSATRAAVEAIAEVSHLERLIGNLSQASSWADLLQKPKPRQGNGRRRKS